MRRHRRDGRSRGRAAEFFSEDSQNAQFLRTNWPIAGGEAISRFNSNCDRTQQPRLGVAKSAEGTGPAGASFAATKQHFRENFARQMRRLIECARMQRHRVAVLVYGLVNFEAYFKGREIAERLRAQDPACYPHL